MARTPRPSLTVAIGGLGAIGLAVARRLDEGIAGLSLAAVSARDAARAATRMAGFRRTVPVVALADLAERADVIVECAPAAAFAEIAEAAIRAGCILVPASVGALLSRPDLIAAAKESGARIVVPTGALLGLDAVRAAAEGTIRSVTMVTRKPPAGLTGAPYLTERGISLDGLTAPLRVFEGTASEGAKGFPPTSTSPPPWAGRHRPGPYAPRDLGRSGDQPQYPYHRGRRRQRALHPDPRDRAVRRQPAYRAHHPLERHCRPARPGCDPQSGVLAAALFALGEPFARPARLGGQPREIRNGRIDGCAGRRHRVSSIECIKKRGGGTA